MRSTTQLPTRECKVYFWYLKWLPTAIAPILGRDQVVISTLGGGDARKGQEKGKKRARH
jgi:hypothetical protein